MFHGCDIGNSCLEYNQYLNWAVLLSYEFNDQAEREVLLNLEVTPYLRYESNTSFFRGQIGFMSTHSITQTGLVFHCGNKSQQSSLVHNPCTPTS